MTDQEKPRFVRRRGERVPKDVDAKPARVNPVTRGPSVFWAVGPADQTQHLFYASLLGRPQAKYACQSTARKISELTVPDEKSDVRPHQKCMEIRARDGLPPPKNIEAVVREQREASEDAFHVAVLGPQGRRDAGC